MGKRTSKEALAGLYRTGIRTSVRTNMAAFGYSVMITITLGMVIAEAGPATIPDLMLFAVGAAAAFTLVEASVTRLFRAPGRGEPAKVVALGNALNFFSITGGAGLAALVVELLPTRAVWFIAPFAATAGYLLVVGVELALARRVER